VSRTEGFGVLLHQDFGDDIAGIPRNMAARILSAIEDRLSRDPTHYGERLRQSLRGFWKMRVGDYRVVYEIVGREVRVYGVMNRRDVYGRIVQRLTRGWTHP
jgi:mRNA interferase RelE/StbE